VRCTVGARTIPYCDSQGGGLEQSPYQHTALTKGRQHRYIGNQGVYEHCSLHARCEYQLARGKNITIRGIGSCGGASTTGIYIDDTPTQNRTLIPAISTLPKTLDLDRVEVLRRPQGILFGAGSEGGTRRYIMT
jgi:hypothetical protein